MPEWQAVNTRNRSFAIGALVDIPAPGAEGVLFAMGSRFGGHALYVKDNRLHYVNSFVGSIEQKVVGSEDIPTGENLILSAVVREGRRRTPTARPGRCRCTTADDEGRRGPHQDPARRVRDRRRRACTSAGTPARPITEDYPGESPYAFTGGTINRVAVDVSGEPYVDLEREAALMLMRE